jgi:ATP-dependent DNA helicase RecG
MWANTVPEGGLIAIGLEDNGSVSGCSRLSQDDLNEREKAGRIYCPDARYETRRIPVINVEGKEDFLLLVRVRYREDKVVCDVSGDAYVRVGDEKHKLTSEEVRELQIDKGQVDLEQEPIDMPYPEDFDLKLVKEFVDSVRRVRKLSEDHSDQEILEHRRLGKFKNGSFIPNVACALMFARDPCVKFPGCKIRFLRIDGEVERTGDQYNVIKDIWVEGPVPHLIVEGARVLESQLREFSRLDADGKFYTAPEYPPEAWYEAIVNACCPSFIWA